MDSAFRWYRKLLQLLPFDFRRDHGHELEQTARELQRQAERRQASLARVWWMLLTDLVRTAPREHLDILRQDVLYSVRSLRKNLAFTTVAVLTLAVGIGANAGIFSFVNSLLLQPVQAYEPERVVRIYGETPRERAFGVISHPTFLDIRERNRSFESVAAHRTLHVVMADSPTAAAEASRLELVSGDYFSLLGMSPARGRPLLPTDDRLSAESVVVVSHRYWQTALGGRPDALGSTVYLNSTPFTVVGITPPEFRGTYAAYMTDAWVPMHQFDRVRRLGIEITQRSWGWMTATARLRSGVTLEHARADLQNIGKHLRAEYPNEYAEDATLAVYPASRMPEDMQQGAAKVLGFCLVVVFLVLLLACSNIAGVMLARVLRRRHEIAIRRAMGADVSRLVRQWTTEALLIAALGGLAGLVVCRWTQAAMLRLVPPSETFSPDLTVDVAVLAFTGTMVLLCALLFGALPAMRTARVDISSVLKEDSGTSTAGRERQRWQSGLVVAQAALSVVLLVTAGLLARSLGNARAFDPGFQGDGVVLASVQLRQLGYTAATANRFYTELLQRLRSTPGITAATFTNIVPLSGNEETHGFIIPGVEPPKGQKTFPFESAEVAPGYFETLQIPIVEGRSFEDRDLGAAVQRVIVNQEFVRRYWPGQNPVGKQLLRATDASPVPVEVVGVARDAKYYSLGEAPMPYLYGAPTGLAVGSQLWVMVRSQQDRERTAEIVRAQIATLDSRLGRIGVTSFEEFREGPLFPQRVLAAVSSTFAAAALLLMTIGLYGMLAQSVQQRTREIGLRLAVGARPRDVMTMVVSRGLALAIAGAAVGLGLAPFLGGALKSLLFGVQPADPVTLAATAALLLLIALMATLLPARRAARVDPLRALRYE